jgi:hypothetical protein
MDCTRTRAASRDVESAPNRLDRRRDPLQYEYCVNQHSALSPPLREPRETPHFPLHPEPQPSSHQIPVPPLSLCSTRCRMRLGLLICYPVLNPLRTLALRWEGHHHPIIREDPRRGQWRGDVSLPAARARDRHAALNATIVFVFVIDIVSLSFSVEMDPLIRAL